MNDDAVYFEFYNAEGLLEEPKRYFVMTADMIAAAGLADGGEAVDLGCANGSFLHYLHHRFPDCRLTGVDVFDQMLEQGRGHLAEATFRNASILDLPDDLHGRFDIVTSLGVMLVFDDADLPAYIDNVLKCLKPGGRAFVMSVFSNNGTDVVARWRPRIDGAPSDWVTDRNVYAFETVADLLDGRCKDHRFVPFDLGMERERTNDPRRAWTLKTELNEHQLVTGPNLLVDQYVLEIET